MIEFMHTGFDGYAEGYAAGRRDCSAPDYGRAWEICLAQAEARFGEGCLEIWRGAWAFREGYFDAIDDCTVEQRSEKQRRLAPR